MPFFEILHVNEIDGLEIFILYSQSELELEFEFKIKSGILGPTYAILSQPNNPDYQKFIQDWQLICRILNNYLLMIS